VAEHAPAVVVELEVLSVVVQARARGSPSQLRTVGFPAELAAARGTDYQGVGNTTGRRRGHGPSGCRCATRPPQHVSNAARSSRTTVSCSASRQLRKDWELRSTACRRSCSARSPPDASHSDASRRRVRIGACVPWRVEDAAPLELAPSACVAAFRAIGWTLSIGRLLPGGRGRRTPGIHGRRFSGTAGVSIHSTAASISSYKLARPTSLGEDARRAVHLPLSRVAPWMSVMR